MYDSDYRECPTAAVNTAYPMTQKGPNTPGSFVVPTNVSRITGIRIFVSGIAADVVTGSVTAVHLFGGGIKLGLGWFVGPLVSIAGAAATAGGFQYADGMSYKTNIPVVPGATFDAEAFINGEDLGTAHMLLDIEYDGVPGNIKDSDYREIDIGAAANTPVAVADRGATAAVGDFLPLSTIGEVIFGAALDPTGDAANGLNWAPALKLSGNGLLNSGNYSFVGPSGPTQPDTDVSGNGNCVVNPSRYICGAGIPVKAGGRITAEAMNIESINPGTAIVGLCYI